MESKEKWYNRSIVGYMLILLPPLGLYGVYKSETIPAQWKKVIFGAFVFAVVGGVLIHSL